jgi:beta-glucosidase
LEKLFYKYFALSILMFVFLTRLNAQDIKPYRDTSLPIDKRVEDLISRMNIDEKIGQLHFDAAAIPRLGLNHWNYWSEAIHGVARWKEATVFPQVIGLGSTWNPELIQKMAHVIGIEARVFNNMDGKGLTYFSPTINLARDPRWGRTEEAYSEDPYLTAQMATSFVKGLQGNNPDYILAGATVKHFLADNSEFQRSISSSYTDMRDLREYYMPAFESAIKQAQSISIMCTYRGLNGIPNSANKWLLNKVLRDEWGFKGYVVSDCWAISDIVTHQHYVEQNEKAVELAIHAGTDLNCGDYYIKYLKSTLEEGLIKESDIDLALSRVLKSRFMMGDLDPKEKVPYRNIPDTLLNCTGHQQLALELARQSIVLMKNDNNSLPLNKDRIKSIAVIGIKAEEPEYGGYSGYPNQAVSILQGIQYLTGAAQNGFSKLKAERFYEGSYITKIIDFSSFEKQDTSEYGRMHVLQIKNNDWFMFKNIDLADGAKAINATASCKGAGGSIEIRLDKKDGDVIGIFKVEDTGDWKALKTVSASIKKCEGIHDIYFSFKGADGIIFNLESFEFIPENLNYTLTKTPVTIKYARGCRVTGKDRSGFGEALKIAKECEKVIFVYGTDLTVSNEGLDPADLNVPAVQRELLQKVYAVNPNVVLVMAVGYPLIIDWEKNNIPAIAGVWYPGQAQGTAVADVLFGNYNPSGKLPMTWYKSVDQLPPFTNYRQRLHDRTYLYFKDDVLFPFGFGLSYTNFSYSNMKTDKETYSDKDTINVNIDIKNTGAVTGTEVVQLYYHEAGSSIKTPLKKLIRFQKIMLNPGEVRSLTFAVPVQDMGFWDIKRNAFSVETAKFKLMAGSSSADLRQMKDIFVNGKKYEQGIIRINCGGDYYVDKNNLEWMPDYGFDFGDYAFTEADIAGADGNAIFQSCRKRCDKDKVSKVNYPNSNYLYNWQCTTCDTTNLYYYFEVLNGKYKVNLYFSEIETDKDNERVFDVSIEGEKMITGLDIHKEAGYRTALVKHLNNIEVKDGYLNINFDEIKGFPCVSGIEIIPED